jgi:hypothetical protein
MNPLEQRGSKKPTELVFFKGSWVFKTELRAYGVWQGILHRCYSPKRRDYKRYGGRGIRVCERWHKFANFLADMGEPTHGQTIDRIDTNGHYSPWNCRWATVKEQCNNTRRNVRLKCFGRDMTLAQWAAETGLPYKTLYSRLHRGWRPEDVLAQPQGTWLTPRSGKKAREA